MTKTNRFEDIDRHATKMGIAYDLVCPQQYALRCAKHGLISQSDAETVSWKDEINALVTQEMLDDAKVTIEDVCESIEFFTATKPVFSACVIGGFAWERFATGKPGYYVCADGYRKGPAQ